MAEQRQKGGKRPVHPLDAVAVRIYHRQIMTAPHLTVWYNTRCPVCDAGIDWQRNRLLAAVRAGRVSFKDINEQPDAMASLGCAR